MSLRRARLQKKLMPDEIAPSMSNFVMLGVDGYDHSRDTFGDIASSRYTSDRIINPHPRFGTLTQNIRLRRNENVDIHLKDENGASDVHMDAMAFGMGCCCLQVSPRVYAAHYLLFVFYYSLRSFNSKYILLDSR
jgi:glutamate--cysteine ligase catalytic subunit